jgi:hypothetical protein
MSITKFKDDVGFSLLQGEESNNFNENQLEADQNDDLKINQRSRSKSRERAEPPKEFLMASSLAPKEDNEDAEIK